MMVLQLDKEQALLTEAALTLFLESLVGSMGALEAIKNSGSNLDKVTIDEMDNEVKEANFAIDKIKELLEQFEKPENNEIDETIEPDFI